MGLLNNTCMSCAYLTDLKGTVIPYKYRESAFDNDFKIWNSGHINYQKLVCHKGELESFESGISIPDIHNKVIIQNECSQWKIFKGISAIATEQREASVKSRNWAKWAFLISLAILIATAIILVYTLKSYYS